MAKQEKIGRGLPWGDSPINLIVGIIVVLAIGAVVIGIIRGRGLPQISQPEEEAESLQEVNLPTKHTVAAGEDLWKISEKYYKTGYNWVDIAAENKLDNPNALEEGMELTIPAATPKVTPTAEQAEEPLPTQVAQGQPTSALTPEPTSEPTATPTSAPTAAPTQVPAGEAITGNSYTVVKGDHLWGIAIRAYGDGYKWVEIARANKLDNPDVIHPGNTFTLLR